VKVGIHLHHETEVSNIQLQNFNMCYFPNENFHTLIPYPDSWVDFFTKDSVALEIVIEDLDLIGSLPNKNIQKNSDHKASA